MQLKIPWACEQSGSITGFTMETSADGPIQREKNKILQVKLKQISGVSYKLRS